MTDHNDVRLPPPLEHAIQRVKLAVRGAAERTVESLGLSSMAASNAFVRDSMLNAQFELNRKAALFQQVFDQSLDDQTRRECVPRADIPLGTPSSWEALSLVSDHELEIKVQAERFGLEITHACEWELRELEAYVGSVLGHARAERDRNPLRPEIVGNAMIRGVEAVVDRPDVRKVLCAEFSRSLAAVLRATYGEIVSDMRKAGVQPVSLSVRTSEDRGSEVSRSGALDGREGERSGHGGMRDARHSVSDGFDPRAARDAGPSTRSGAPWRGPGSGRGTPIGQVDAGMMQLLRRLSFADATGGAGGPGGADTGGSGWQDGDGYPLAAPNLIHAHRDELRQASRGALDHMVIDIIGGLFDQILSDPKVPPQLARQIARLQLPVLRAALGDSSFFSSRRHPVRRFVNRIASLGAAFEDFEEAHAKAFLAKVRDLVHEVVEGDFDQIETYEQKLVALENFAAEMARKEVGAGNGEAEALLARKEDELRLHAHYSQQLQGELHGLAAPEFVRDFVAQVWSQVLLKAADKDGPQSVLVKKLRNAGRELFMSVQPKTSPQQRKTFLAELPKLMQDLNEGMDLVGWPEPAKRAFFGQLLPAHAEALKAQIVRTLDFNMLQRQVEQALERNLPTRNDLPPPSAQQPVLDNILPPPTFTKDEAQRIGLVEESAIDWTGKVDIDLSAEPEVTAVDLELPGLPAATEPVEPTRGRALADNVQIGFAYQMHLDGEWQKVRLGHVSPGRTFFVFIRGRRHEQTISLTHRMLVKLCETNRMRAFESAYLMERATARARRQLASLGGGTASAAR